MGSVWGFNSTYKDGELHSYNDLPATVGCRGEKYWYKDGKIHRDNDLPAIIYENGSMEWCKNGKPHRDYHFPGRGDDAPAVICTCGCETAIWYINGVKIKKGTYTPRIKSARI